MTTEKHPLPQRHVGFVAFQLGSIRAWGGRRNSFDSGKENKRTMTLVV